jgi:hypothetical protein
MKRSGEETPDPERKDAESDFRRTESLNLSSAAEIDATYAGSRGWVLPDPP